MTRYLSIAIGTGRAPEAPVLTPARLADWCRRFTPLAAPDAPDGAMLDISGVAHLFGGEASLADDIERRLARHGFDARAAIADTPEAAWALARHGRSRAAPAGADEKALRRLMGGMSVAALRLSPDTLLALSRAGLKCVDDILMRPRAPIAARFGEALFARLDGLMGRAKSPITPRFEAPAYVVERRFADPISRLEDVRGVIAMLAVDLCRMLERHGEGARQLEASLFRVDGAARRVAASASRPLREPKTIAMLFDERVNAASEHRDDDPFDSGYGFDLIRLCAMEVETLGHSPRSLPFQTDARPASQALRHAARMEPQGAEVAAAASLPGLRREAMGGDIDPEVSNEALADLIDRLGARLGVRRVMRLVAQDTHMPEFAVAMVPAAEMRSTRRASVQSSSEKSIPNRPIRLFEQPELVEALAEVPDGPPLRFRWRRVMHEVAAIEGPERIAPEWWKGPQGAPTRDYFRVEDTLGARFWLYREGLYGVETTRPRWFMHGLFA